MQPALDQSAPSSGRTPPARWNRVDQADAVLRALLTSHAPHMWRVAAALVGEPSARRVVCAAAGLHLRYPGQAADRVDLLTAVCDLARPMPDPNGVFARLPATVREAYVLTQLGELTYSETAQALRSTPGEIRAACKAARDLLIAAPVVMPPRRPPDTVIPGADLPTGVSHG